MACRRRIEECVEIYRAAGIQMFTPTVSFDLRGRVAGKAIYSARPHVQLNAVLLNENQEEFIADTVGHEVAHLATRTRYGARPSSHGPEWQRMMRLIGQTPSRTHSYDTSNSAVSSKRHTWTCGCREHQLTTRRHRAALERGASCKICGGVLTPRSAPATPAFRPTSFRPTASVSRVPAPGAPRAPASPVPAVGRPGGRPPAPLTPSRLRASAPTAPSATPAVLPPTEKQLSYARHLAQKSGLAPSAAVWANRAALSSWMRDALAHLANRGR